MKLLETDESKLKELVKIGSRLSFKNRGAGTVNHIEIINNSLCIGIHYDDAKSTNRKYGYNEKNPACSMVSVALSHYKDIIKFEDEEIEQELFELDKIYSKNEEFKNKQDNQEAAKKLKSAKEFNDYLTYRDNVESLELAEDHFYTHNTTLYDAITKTNGKARILYKFSRTFQENYVRKYEELKQKMKDKKKAEKEAKRNK